MSPFPPTRPLTLKVALNAQPTSSTSLTLRTVYIDSADNITQVISMSGSVISKQSDCKQPHPSNNAYAQLH
jgi:hypothetical protein